MRIVEKIKENTIFYFTILNACSPRNRLAKSAPVSERPNAVESSIAKVQRRLTMSLTNKLEAAAAAAATATTPLLARETQTSCAFSSSSSSPPSSSVSVSPTSAASRASLPLERQLSESSARRRHSCDDGCIQSAPTEAIIVSKCEQSKTRKYSVESFAADCSLQSLRNLDDLSATTRLHVDGKLESLNGRIVA